MPNGTAYRGVFLNCDLISSRKFTFSRAFSDLVSKESRWEVISKVLSATILSYLEKILASFLMKIHY